MYLFDLCPSDIAIRHDPGLQLSIVRNKVSDNQVRKIGSEGFYETLLIGQQSAIGFILAVR
jgi:hypothetical protein